MDKSTTTNSATADGQNEAASAASNPNAGCGNDNNNAASTTNNNNTSGNCGRPNSSNHNAFQRLSSANGIATSSTSCSSSSSSAAAAAASSSSTQMINLNISTTTGGNFGVSVEPHINVESLKKIIAKKLKVAKDRICLLHREKELQDGTLRDHNLMDGSKIILIPNVETGLLAQRPENTVMQALESLNDSQVNDFLSGKTPLNLSMRLGDHMMLIQLQLSTVNPAGGGSSSTSTAATAALPAVTGCSSSSSSSSLSSVASSASSSSSSSSSSAAAAAILAGLSSSTSAARTRSSGQRSGSNGGRIGHGHVHSHQHPSLQHGHGHGHHGHHHHHHHHPHQHNASAVAAGSGGGGGGSSSSGMSCWRKVYEDMSRSGSSAGRHNSTHSGQAHQTEGHQNGGGHAAAASAMKGPELTKLLIKRGIQNIVKSIALKEAPRSTAAGPSQSPGTKAVLEQSPIKSLSNLVSSPIKTTAIKNIPMPSSTTSSSNSSGGCSSGGCQQDPIAAKLTSCLCTRLATPLAAPAPVVATSSSGTGKCPSESTANAGFAARAINPTYADNKAHNSRILMPKHRHHHHHHHHQPHPYHQSAARKMSEEVHTAPANNAPESDDSNTSSSASSSLGVSDTRNLAEASRNLTQTLRKLSKEVFTNKIDLSGASGGSVGLSSGSSSSGAAGSCGSGEEAPRKNGSGAVIESMKNHGKGIYSGTFSGTLNPALQDRYGRPKRDISTVIHILNDLLSATPQYSRGARISFEAPTIGGSAAGSSSGSSGSAGTNGSSSSSTGVGSSAAGAASSSSSGLHRSSRSSKMYSSKHHNCAKCNSRAQQQQAAAAAALASGSCAYGECNGHYVTKTASTTSSSSSTASSSTINGSKSSQSQQLLHSCCNSNNGSGNSINESNSALIQGLQSRNGNCNCRYGPTGEREHMCQKCSVELDNMKTKSKMDQLRLVMQQRKQKREARKLKSGPYAAAAGQPAVSMDAAPQYSAVSALVATPLQAAAATPATNKTPLNTNNNNTSNNINNSCAPAATAAATASTTSEVSPNHIVEEVDTAA